MLGPRPARLLLVLALGAVAAGAVGCSDDEGSPPEARLDAPAFVSLGTSAVLSAARSSDPDGDIVAYRFIVGDGTTDKQVSEPRLSHIFKLAGSIEVLLEVVDSEGHTSRDTALVSVRRP